MPEQSNIDGVTKIPKLTRVDDLINWRRRAKAFLQQQDVELLHLTTRPKSASSSHQCCWLEANIKAKNPITFTSVGSLVAQISILVGSDGKKQEIKAQKSLVNIKHSIGDQYRA